MLSLSDTYNRQINYLRVSVTDRCNFRCAYCMPPEGVPWRPHAEILRFEEIAAVVRAAAALGISKVRLTGGEPLVRAGIVELVALLAAIPGLDDLSMTTNGALLARHAADLRRAGLRRVNVSLDTLDPERFQRITRLGRLADVLAGIAAAQAAGLLPVKLNTVAVRGFNDDELVALAAHTIAEDWHVRFIELMPVGMVEARDREPRAGGACQDIDTPNVLLDTAEHSPEAGFIAVAEIKARIEAALGVLTPARPTVGNGPARYYRLTGARGTIGFISPVSEHFCNQCNRLRLTADGHLRPCLLADGELDLRTPLRQGASQADIQALFRQAIQAKPQGHRLAEQVRPQVRAMSQIGG
jgi:cyclic pyranopterin phosphate synthase